MLTHLSLISLLKSVKFFVETVIHFFQDSLINKIPHTLVCVYVCMEKLKWNFNMDFRISWFSVLIFCRNFSNLMNFWAKIKTIFRIVILDLTLYLTALCFSCHIRSVTYLHMQY